MFSVFGSALGGYGVSYAAQQQNVANQMRREQMMLAQNRDPYGAVRRYEDSKRQRLEDDTRRILRTIMTTQIPKVTR